MNLILSISLDFDYMPLLVIASLAWLIPMGLSLIRARRVPSVIAEIIAGYIAGVLLLSNTSEETMRILEFLALTGFIFLMFLSGLEINMDQLAGSLPRRKVTMGRLRKNFLVIALIYFLITILLSYASASALSFLVEINNRWYFALIMVTTSIGIILPVLKSRGESSGAYGQLIIITAAVADIMSIILFTFTAFVLQNGFRPDILLILLLFAILYMAYRLGSRFWNLSGLRRVSFQLSNAASQVTIRGTFMLLLVFVVLSQLISPEVILLGAFMTGILLSLFLHRERSLLLVKLDGIGYGFFIPVFFIMVGVTFDPPALSEFELTLFPFLTILLFLLFAIKIIPALLFRRQFGLRSSVSAGFLLSSRLSLIIAASAIGLEMGVISPGINAVFIIMAVLSCLLGPMLYTFTSSVGSQSPGRTIIIGGSSRGVLLARRLKIHNRESLIVEKDADRCNDIGSKGLKTICADGSDQSLYPTIGLSPDNYVVVETGSEELNIRICEMIRKDLGHERIITMANELAIEKRLKRLSIETIDARRVMATTIENLIVRPTTYHALVETFENFSVEEIMITGSLVDGQKVKDVAFHYNAILIMIKRGNNIFIPHGDTYLRTGDILNVFGTDTALDDARTTLQA